MCIYIYICVIICLLHLIEIATRSADARGVQRILRVVFLFCKRLAHFLVRTHVPDAGDAGNARDATTQRTGTDPIFDPTFQDFQTRKIDNTENTRDVGNAGNAAGWPQKVQTTSC